ncbi:4'-phosphopantetheinyl transferase superfamily protein [Frigidibacter sp. SD6-1]|uniref:4'-phosphopantetheinyl transferase family protein n=1 Tax=Frigidibacter sp. SD6-1 TaxID=3032581 RepID=UPI0024E01A75|nr:4'-phosphopantetheinyl transferase superfamily protein [Frigidibacter sp. SD6-1]
MIDGALDISAPFDLPDLVWAGVRLQADPADEAATGLAHEDAETGAYAIALPDTLGRAVGKRRREYLAGRLCAAHALRRLAAPEALGQNGRAPVWPAGTVGSITHTDRRALAIASRRHARLGLDCEEVMGAEQAERLAPAILAPGDAAVRPASLGFAAFVTLVFSAKEAFYKAHSAAIGRVADFTEARITGLAPDRLHLAFEGRDHMLRWRLSGSDCLTLLAEPAP